jgi:hypothetical protein
VTAEIWAKLDAENLMLRYRITALENHITALGFGFDQVEPKVPRNQRISGPNPLPAQADDVETDPQRNLAGAK